MWNFFMPYCSTGQVVIQLSTYDGDVETDPDSNNAKVRYQILSGNRDHFQIGENSGEIKVSPRARLDVDSVETYEILVSL